MNHAQSGQECQGSCCCMLTSTITVTPMYVYFLIRVLHKKHSHWYPAKGIITTTFIGVCVYMLFCGHNGGKHGCYGSYRIIVRINQDHGGSEAVLALTHLACFFNRNTTELTEACWNVLAWLPYCNSDATWRYNKPLLPLIDSLLF